MNTFRDSIYNTPNIFTITASGDSQTDLTGAAVYGNPAYKAWMPVLSSRLNLRGCKTKARVFGVSGQTTAHFLGRSSDFFKYDTPTIGIIYGGVNDPGSGITGTAQAGTSNTITLASSVVAYQNAYFGNVITITSGTGNGQTNTIIGFSTSRVATVKNNWTTVPDSTSVYSIAAPTQAQMQANHQALIKILKFNVRGGQGDLVAFVQNPALLPANAIAGTRYLVMEDNSITGGIKENHPTHHVTITGDYSSSVKQSVWEYRNTRSGELGWGRVGINTTSAFSDGVSKIISMGSNYLNWTSGGDNYNTTTNTGTQYTSYVPVRAAAQAAAIAEGTVYCDIYDFQSKLIYGGTFLGNVITSETTQSSGDFHYIPTNQHYSAYGHETVARALEYTIINQNWLNDLINS